MYGFRIAKVLALSLSLALLSAPARAVEPQEVTDALSAALTATGRGDLSVARAEKDGDAVILQGLTIPLEEDGQLMIENARFDQLEVRSQGGIKAGQAMFERAQYLVNGQRIDVPSVTIDNLTIPSAEEIGNELRGSVAAVYERLEARDISFLREEGDAAGTVERLEFRFDDFDGLAANQARFTIDAFALPLNQATVSGPLKNLSALGFEEIAGRFLLDLRAMPEESVAAIENFELDLTDVGRLAVTGRIADYDVEAMRQAMSSSSTGSPASGPLTSILPVLMNASLDKLEIRFEDKSITNRILEARAASAGGTRDQVVDQINGILPALLGGLQNPGFESQVAAAMREFLATPDQITVTAEPGEPVEIARIAAAGRTSPQTLPDLLNVTVKASN